MQNNSLVAIPPMVFTTKVTLNCNSLLRTTGTRVSPSFSLTVYGI